MYNKNKVTDIKTKLAGDDRGTCTGAAADIELASGESEEVEPTATDGDCIFYVYNNNGGTVKLTLTETVCIPNCYALKYQYVFHFYFQNFFGSGLANAELIIYAGGDKAKGVRICELESSLKTCKWFDALAVIYYKKKANSDPNDGKAIIEHIP